MAIATLAPSKKELKFPPFSLTRLLQTIFQPKPNEKLCILIDLENPKDVINFAFLKNPKNAVQKKAYDVVYQGLLNGVKQELQFSACDFFAYQTTGGSNLELPDTAIAPDGRVLNLVKDIYSIYDIILAITDFSATAPLTASCKLYGFRGATMHGMNDIILQTGLAVDYNEVSRETEKLRLGMTHADSVEIDFSVDGKEYHLWLDLGHQRAQKSHGLCHTPPDVANLPAGEVYFVPLNAKGNFPIKFDDGTIGLMEVANGRAHRISLIRGNENVIKEHQNKLDTDPATGILGELGFGTQNLPFSGRDIQDEKIFGTFHIATGRNDHLGGHVLFQNFVKARNASHDDILYSTAKTPEIQVNQVRMQRYGKTEILFENYEPAAYLMNLRNSPLPPAFHESPYETNELLDQYMLLHYGNDEDLLPFSFGPTDSLHFPERCVTACVNRKAISKNAKALDLGCAVGRSSFELAKHFEKVVAIDNSSSFISAAKRLQQKGQLEYSITEEGGKKARRIAKLPSDTHPNRVEFRQCDVMSLANEQEEFDVVLAANLLCRVPDPTKFLELLAKLVVPNGQLIITSPYSWLEEYTVKSHWLGSNDSKEVKNMLGAIEEILKSAFELQRSFDLPFLLREHYRKYQWVVSQASIWKRKAR